MKPFEVIVHNGKNIAVVDLSGTSAEQAIPLLVEAQEKIALMPKKSVLLFTDGRKAVFNKQSMDALKKFSLKVDPHVAASATLAEEGLGHVALQAVERVVKKNLRSFHTRQEALNWLAARHELRR